MRKFKIITPMAKVYYVHDDNNIERGDLQEVSGQWKMVGVASTHPFARHYEPHLSTLAAIADGQEDALYKNGNPRYTIVDNDHGSVRVWGNSAAHGIKSVSRC